MKGTIISKDLNGDTVPMKFNGVSDLPACQTLASALQPYCDGDLFKRAVQDGAIVNGAPGTGAYATTEHKAVILYEDLNAGFDETSRFRFELATPKESVFENTDEGYRVTQAAGDAIIAALATATGKTLRFVEGYPKTKKDQR